MKMIKDSDRLRLEAQMEGSDIKSLALHTKALREDRLYYFKESVLPALSMSKRFKSHIAYANSYRIVLDKCTVTIYPKANKLLIHNVNKWKKPAVNWLLNYCNVAPVDTK